MVMSLVITQRKSSPILSNYCASQWNPLTTLLQKIFGPVQIKSQLFILLLFSSAVSLNPLPIDAYHAAFSTSCPEPFLQQNNLTQSLFGLTTSILPQNNLTNSNNLFSLYYQQKNSPYFKITQCFIIFIIDRFWSRSHFRNLAKTEYLKQ